MSVYHRNCLHHIQLYQSANFISPLTYMLAQSCSLSSIFAPLLDRIKYHVIIHRYRSRFSCSPRPAYGDIVSTVQYSTVQYSTVQYSTVQCDVGQVGVT